MLKNEHVQIYSGKKLILEGSYWTERTGKCARCSIIARLPDDVRCEWCQVMIKQESIMP